MALNRIEVSIQVARRLNSFHERQDYENQSYINRLHRPQYYLSKTSESTTNHAADDYKLEHKKKRKTKTPLINTLH